MDTTQLLKGTLDAAVLAVIADEDGYGYDVVRRLRESGLEEVGDASVYGTLRRLFASGLADLVRRGLRGGAAPQVLRAHTRRSRRAGRRAQGLGRVRPRHGPPAGIPADRGDALMNDDTTGTTRVPHARRRAHDGPARCGQHADDRPAGTGLRPAQPAGSPARGRRGRGSRRPCCPTRGITPYLDAAAIHLADLPPGERAELLEDLAAHLAEIAADEGPAFATRLGSPDQYAAEFRASAGYPPAGSGSAGAAQPGTAAHAGPRRRPRPPASWAPGSASGVRGFPGGTALMSLLPRLRPAWWVFRAWLAALVVGVDWPTGAYNGIGPSRCLRLPDAVRRPLGRLGPSHRAARRRRAHRGAHRPVRSSTGSRCGSASWACSAAGR